MGKRHKTTVTYLELLVEPRLPSPVLPRCSHALLRAVKPPVHFYRYLYDTIGRHYAWVSRKVLSDEELAAIIHDDNVEIYILYLEGTPAGFTEIDFRKQGQAEISFLGIIPERIGEGLGRYMLSEAIKLAWARRPQRVAIQTCTMDHPNALPLYQLYGFRAYAQAEAEIEEP